MAGMQQMLLGAGSSATVINLTVAANTSVYNIFTAAGSPSGPAAVTVTVNSGVVVRGTGTGTFVGMDTGTGWAPGSTLALVNNGTIAGAPGQGGFFSANGIASNVTYGANGGDGGTGLRAQYPITVTNNGTIAGGGGGGGSGSTLNSDNGGGGNVANYGGNGGGGLSGSFQQGGNVGGNIPSYGGTNSTVLHSESQTAPGTTSAAGGAGAGDDGADQGGNPNAVMPKGFTGTGIPAAGNTVTIGGGGGGVGAHGGGGPGVHNAQYGFSSTVGGWPGSYVVGNSNVTWAVNGTRVGYVDGAPAGGVPVRLRHATVLAVSAGSPTTVSATLTFNTDGTISGTTAGFASHTFSDNWYKPTTASIGSSYYIRATVVTGTNLTSPSSGTTGSWLQLNSARSWANSISSATNKQSKLTIEIATDAAGTNIIASAAYYLKVYRSA